MPGVQSPKFQSWLCNCLPRHLGRSHPLTGQWGGPHDFPSCPPGEFPGYNTGREKSSRKWGQDSKPSLGLKRRADLLPAAPGQLPCRRGWEPGDPGSTLTLATSWPCDPRWPEPEADAACRRGPSSASVIQPVTSQRPLPAPPPRRPPVPAGPFALTWTLAACLPSLVASCLPARA